SANHPRLPARHPQAAATEAACTARLESCRGGVPDVGKVVRDGAYGREVYKNRRMARARASTSALSLVMPSTPQERRRATSGSESTVQGNTRRPYRCRRWTTPPVTRSLKIDTPVFGPRRSSSPLRNLSRLGLSGIE